MKTRVTASCPIFSRGNQDELRPSLRLLTGPKEPRAGVPGTFLCPNSSHPHPHPHMLAMLPLTLGACPALQLSLPGCTLTAPSRWEKPLP